MNATFKLLKREGFREEFKKGVKQGIRKAHIDSIACKLNERFGAYPDHLRARVVACPRRSTMEILLDAAYESASLEEFESIVDSCLGRECEVKSESLDVV